MTLRNWKRVMQDKQYECNREIPIMDGRISCGFGILPVRVIDYTDTDAMDNIDEMTSAEISIVDVDVEHYLLPFLYKHFDNKLEANKKRVDTRWLDNDGNEHLIYKTSFEGPLTYNFFTFESIQNILTDIKDTIAAFSSGKDNEFTKVILFGKTLNQGQISERKARISKKTMNAETEMIIDFYCRFCKKMENMIELAQKAGYELIMFMSP